MGSRFPHPSPPCIRLAFPPRFPPHRSQLCNVWNTRPLWTAWSSHRLDPCASGRAFDTTSVLCTAPFHLAVGSVGNHLPLSPFTTTFSKSPDLHSPVLENSPPSQPPAPRPLRPISHFSSPPTGTTAFVLILFTYNHPLRRTSSPSLIRSLTPSRFERRPGRQLSPPRVHPRNPEKCPCFPPPRLFMDAYNQEKKRQSLPRGYSGVVE
jgi:hypothetical protein